MFAQLIFCCRLGWELYGAAVAQISCQATLVVLLLSYQWYRDGVLLRRSSQRTWHGCSLQALTGWGSYLSYGLPAVAMICLEWWVWEIMIMLAGEPYH